jgi:hypothetical protein
MPQNTKQRPHATVIRRIIPSTTPHLPLAYSICELPRSLDGVHRLTLTLLFQSIASIHLLLQHRKWASTVIQPRCSRGGTSIWNRDDETGTGTKWHKTVEQS